MSIPSINSGQAPKLFDVHTHTQFAAFSNETDAVIKRALDAGVWMINVGTQKDTSKKAVEIANRYRNGVYATVGLHPIHTEKSYHDSQEISGDEGFTSREEEFDYGYYRNLAQDPKVVAIGECGFDYYRLVTNDMRQATSIKEKQKKALEAQIKLAIELQKPLMLHCRPSKDDDAYGDLLETLRPHVLHLKPSVIHFFVGSLDTEKNFLELGFSFTFGGVITFARDYDEAIKTIPLDRILLETDAPYVAPIPYRGKRNEPLYVTEVARKIAEIKDIPFEDVAEITARNSFKIFDIKK